jgi:cardiolipin synthase
MLNLVPWIILLSGWLAGLALVPVLARRYDAPRAWGWLAVIFALPWVGLVLYFLLGENPLGRRRTVRYKRLLASLDARHRRRVLEKHEAAALNESWAGLGRLAEACGALPAVGGNAAEVLAEHAHILDRLVADIDAARHHVHMVFYIFADDDAGRRVGEALARAASRGVACRLVADAVGSYGMTDTLGEELRAAGVEVVEAMPVNPLRRGRLARIDLRNHRKIAVIDGRVGYIGSWNVVRPDFRPRAHGAYVDILMRVQGPAVLQFQMLFLEDWQMETGGVPDEGGLLPEPETPGDAVIQTVPSGPLYPFRPVRDIAVSAIHQARRSVTLTTPYFVPEETLMLALRTASQRGVAVDVIGPARSDSWLVDAIGRSYYRRLLEAGVRVHLYRRGFLHAKTLTVDDDFAVLGSANFDVRSFRLNVEANVVVTSPALAGSLRAVQDAYRADADTLDAEVMDARPLWRRVADDTARLASPLM